MKLAESDGKPAGEGRRLGLRAGLADLPCDSALRREVVATDRSKEVLVAPGGRDVAVVCVAGGVHQVGLHIHVFDRYLAEHDITAIYLRDFSRRFHVHGVGALGPTQEATVSALRRLLDELGAKVVHTLGSSAGGFGALAYGADLGARRVLSFSGATSFSRVHCSPEMLELDRRVPQVIDRLQAAAPDLEHLDMRARLAAAPPCSEIHLYYGKHMPVDRAHARHLDGIAGVHLHPVAHYQGHNSIGKLASTGKLRGIVTKLLAEA